MNVFMSDCVFEHTDASASEFLQPYIGYHGDMRPARYLCKKIHSL